MPNAAFSPQELASGLTKLDVNAMGVSEQYLTTVLGTAHYGGIQRKAIEVQIMQYSPLDCMPVPELKAGLLNQDFFILVDPPVPAGQTGIFRNRYLLRC